MNELKSTRSGFGAAITKLGKTNKKVTVVSANLASSVKVADFAKAHPERFFECGVAENNMAGVAAGLALQGKIAFACSFATFSPYINWAVIRQSICMNKAHVIIASTHAGIITGPDGATHQALEDLALMQALPNMTVLVPTDFDQAYESTLKSAEINGPVYLRLTRPDTEQLKDLGFKENKFRIGKAHVLKKGKDLTLISCGPIIFEAIKAVKELEKKTKKTIELINCHTLKPLDQKTILDSVKKTQKCLTLEDHQVFGGLGTTISQFLSKNYPVPIEMMGFKDRFGESARSGEELIKKFGLNSEAILKKISKF